MLKRKQRIPIRSGKPVNLVRGMNMLADECKGQEAGQNGHHLRRPGQRWQIDSFSVVRRQGFDGSPWAARKMTLIIRDWDSQAGQNGLAQERRGLCEHVQAHFLVLHRRE